MVKCNRGQVRRLKTSVAAEKTPILRQRIQMVLLREAGMTQPAIAEAMGVSLSTVNRAHMAFDRGGLTALKPKPSGGRMRENMTLGGGEGLAGAVRQGGGGGRDGEHSRS